MFINFVDLSNEDCPLSASSSLDLETASALDFSKAAVTLSIGPAIPGSIACSSGSLSHVLSAAATGRACFVSLRT
jgi:hypothetical protein